MLALAAARVQVARREDRLDRKADALEGPASERDDVPVGEQRVEVDGAVRRRLLEERIGVVPGSELGHGAPEPLDEARVERSFPARERRGCGAVGRGERLDQLCLVELVRREREREPVAVPEGARGLVAEAGELADV